ncbi:hypothetical protein [Streptomyces sp. NPDC001250]|uniref:hypothetical protein n=1 Tax=unclassified Streptomyces TaxID=2593676 RepID=UPI00331AEF8C
MQTGAVGNAQLARRVNAVGRELGLTLHYDKTTVSQWLKGSIPKPEARPAMVEALSRFLGRPVTSSELGWLAQATEETNIVAGVMELSRSDMDPSRRGVLAGSLYSAALLVPKFENVNGVPTATPQAGRTLHIGASDVETVRTMTDKIADILDTVGAGHARPMAAAFLLNTAGPYLRASGTERVQLGMRAAVADLVYFTGWMAMYEERQGLGQRYCLKALKLAGAAEDHITYCRTLRGMSLQACHLGHGKKALDLADAAAEAAPAAGPRLVAFLRGQQAASAAMTGDRRTALARLRETETALAQADNRRDAVGGYDEVAYHFHVAGVRWHLGDQEASIRALRQSNRARSPQERQGRLHCLGVVAERQFAMRHVEAAATTWAEFLDEHMALSSARGHEHLKTLLSSVPAYRGVRAVREPEEHARHVAALKAA